MWPRHSRPRAHWHRSWRSSTCTSRMGTASRWPPGSGAWTPPPDVVLTSSHDGAELAQCVAESSARGFVPKTELSREAIEELLQ